jgi:hypothetical protein
VTAKFSVFWDVTQCSLVDPCLGMYLEVGGSTFFRNVVNDPLKLHGSCISAKTSDIFRNFVEFLHPNSRVVPELGHDHFLATSFQLIIQMSDDILSQRRPDRLCSPLSLLSNGSRELFPDGKAAET